MFRIGRNLALAQSFLKNMLLPPVSLLNSYALHVVWQCKANFPKRAKTLRPFSCILAKTAKKLGLVIA